MKLGDISLFKFMKRPEHTEEAEKEENFAAKLAAAEYESAERQEGRLPLLPMAAQLKPSVLTIVWLALAVVLIAVSVLVKSLPPAIVLVLRIAAALGVGFNIIWDTVNNLKARVFSCDGLPVLIAALLAYMNGMSLEAAIALTTLQAAICLRNYAYCRAADSLCAGISLPDGAAELGIGDSFMLETAQRVPVDCKILQGSVIADLSFVTGERSEKAVKAGDSLPAGCTVMSGSAMAEAQSRAADSAVFGIADAISSGYDKPSRTELLINKYANYLFPLFLTVSLVLLMVLTFANGLEFRESLRRVITILAVASPCGVLVSIPILYLASMVKQRNLGTVFLSPSAMDNAACAKTVVIDKTGTITSERFQVAEVFSDRMDPLTFLKVAAHAAFPSKNPMALAVNAAYSAPVDYSLVADAAEFPGWGMSVIVEGIKILLGTGGFMSRNQVSVAHVSGADCVLYMAVGGIYAGRISLANPIDGKAAEVVSKLADFGIDRIAMVSGDGRDRDGGIAKEIGINEYFCECTDSGKAGHINELRTRVHEKSTIAYIASTSGSTEAARSADVTIAAGSSDVKILGGEADVLVLGAGIERLPELFIAGKRTRWLVLGFSLIGILVKLIIAILAYSGIAPLWFGVLLDSCTGLALLVSATAIVNIKSL